MCGWALAWDRRAPRAEALGAAATAMAQALRHRVPDDDGAWVDPQAGMALGFRRLAIVDLSAEGHQPMVSGTGRYVVVFNGEIYNFEALRADLAGRGSTFRGHSDTEVLLAAVEEWGPRGAVQRCMGMFSLALWDRTARVVHLVRDRLGIKPLYYSLANGLLVAGSELKALRAHPRFAPQVSRSAAASFLQRKYVPSPHTIYEGVFQLPPGTLLTLPESATTLPDPEVYWSAADIARAGLMAPLRVSDAEATDMLEAALRESVRLHMLADVPLGAFLSGGVDSTSVVALMQAQSSQRVRTYTIGFEEHEYDEAAQAAAAAAHLGTEHTVMRVSAADALGVVPELAEIYDEPLADSSQIPTVLLSRLTRSHVTVALSGDGGDELFGGYGRYQLAPRFSDLSRLLRIAPLDAMAGAAARISAARYDGFLGALAPLTGRTGHRGSPGDKLLKLIDVLRAGDQQAVYHRYTSLWPEAWRLIEGGEQEPPYARVPSIDSCRFQEWMMLEDTVTYLPDDILTKVDRASMSVGLEARVPLLDHRLVELAWRFPLGIKIRGRTGKWLLRQVLYRYVPRALVERPKRGFDVPVAVWLRGPLREWAADLLSEAMLRKGGLLEPAPVRRAWQEHLSGVRDWRDRLWAVLMLQSWLLRWG